MSQTKSPKASSRASSAPATTSSFVDSASIEDRAHEKMRQVKAANPHASPEERLEAMFPAKAPKAR